MKHDQKFLIIGFCDASWKWHGTWQNTYFKPEDQYTATHIPSQTELKAYAESLGYWPSGKRGSTLNRCTPIYTHIGEGLDYTACMVCFPSREIIDNRVGA